MEPFHELRVEKLCAGARGVEQDNLRRLIVEAERELQPVGCDLRGREAEVEYRPWAGHHRRGIFLRGQGNLA